MKVRNALKATALFMTGCVALLGSTQLTASQWQSAESISAAAQRHVAGGGATPGAADQIEVAALDPRLKLPACDEPLQTETPFGRSRGSRITVRVSCNAAANWRIHVPVEIKRIGHVVATTRALARGSVMQLSDLTTVESELGQLGHGYFLNPANVSGQRLRRAVPAGSILTPAQLEAATVIQRGQTVTIVANSGGLGIKMSGKAMANGAVGQIIDVENTSSGKRVQGIVRSARAVEILLR